MYCPRQRKKPMTKTAEEKLNNVIKSLQSQIDTINELLKYKRADLDTLLKTDYHTKTLSRCKREIRDLECRHLGLYNLLQIAKGETDS